MAYLAVPIWEPAGPALIRISSAWAPEVSTRQRTLPEYSTRPYYKIVSKTALFDQNCAHISKVEVDEAPPLPATVDNHKSYDTSATRSDEAEVYVHCHAVGTEPISEIVFPSPTRRSKFASVTNDCQNHDDHEAV